jgi:hypothetical protein
VKGITILVSALCFVLIAAAVWWANDAIAPLFLNSRLERLAEKNLPKITIESGNTIYCRMKADDFRFALPLGSRATNLVVTGVFDSVDGSVEARFESTNQVPADEYERWLSGKLQFGGRVSAKEIAGGLLIEFHYFGDK